MVREVESWLIDRWMIWCWCWCCSSQLCLQDQVVEKRITLVSVSFLSQDYLRARESGGHVCYIVIPTSSPFVTCKPSVRACFDLSGGGAKGDLSVCMSVSCAHPLVSKCLFASLHIHRDTSVLTCFDVAQPGQIHRKVDTHAPLYLGRCTPLSL